MAKLVKDCDNCKHRMKDIYEHPCNLCKRGKPDNWEPIPKQSNFECITASVGMFADFLISVGGDNSEKIPYCKSTPRCTEILENGELIPDEMCMECLIKWLQSEVEET